MQYLGESEFLVNSATALVLQQPMNNFTYQNVIIVQSRAISICCLAVCVRFRWLVCSEKKQRKSSSKISSHPS